MQFLLVHPVVNRPFNNGPQLEAKSEDGVREKQDQRRSFNSTKSHISSPTFNSALSQLVIVLLSLTNATSSNTGTTTEYLSQITTAAETISRMIYIHRVI